MPAALAGGGAVAARRGRPEPSPSRASAAAAFLPWLRARSTSTTIGTTEMSTIRMRIISMCSCTKSILPSIAPSTVTPTPQRIAPTTLYVMKER